MTVTGENNVAVAGLVASTNYKVFVMVKDAAGNRSTLSVATFTTIPGAIITGTTDGAGVYTISVNENTTAVTTVVGTTHGASSWSIPFGADKDLFSIGASTGVLTFTGARNFEAPVDADLDGIYEVQVRLQDLGVTGAVVAQTLIITVTNVNEAPTDITLSASSIAENNAANATVGTLSTTDVDAGDTFTYTLVAGTGDTDNASFTIVGTALKITPVANFETKATYSIRVQSTDAGGLTFEKQFTVTITDVAESAAYSATTLSEAGANNGSITATITITLTGETFALAVRGTNLAARVTNTPAGLTPVLTVNAGGTAATLSFTGSATNHANLNDVNNLSVTFVNSDFTGGTTAGIIGINKNNLVIDFADPADVTAPTLSATSASGTTATTTTLNYTTDEAGTYFVLIYAAADPAPDAAAVIAQGTAVAKSR